MQHCRNRRLNHILASRTLAKRFFAPLARAVLQCLALEKDQSWFPKLPMLGYFVVMVQFQVGLLSSLRSVVEHVGHGVGCLTRGFDVKLSTLSDGLNSRRRLRVVRQVFAALVLQARQQLPKPFRNFTRLAALDSTLLHCVASAQWATYRKQVNAVKGHLLFELAQSIPSQLVLAVAKHHDRTYFRQFLRTGWTYVIDRAYNDYQVFADMIAEGIFFVIKKKSNAVYTVLKKHKIKRAHKKKGVLQDRTIRLGGYPNQMAAPLRLIVFKDAEERTHHFLTNRFDLTPFSIAELYRARGSIEIFFKWLKRTLRARPLLARSMEAAEIQVLTALITDLLLKLLCGLPAFARHIPVRTLRLIRQCLLQPDTPHLLQKIQLSLET